MNEYESKQQSIIPAVLVYAMSNQHVLMMLKTRNDIHKNKYNGLGGKCNLGESALDAAKREFKEESGIDVNTTDFKPAGVLQFPNFKPAQDWLVYVYTVQLDDHYSLEEPAECNEGKLEWIKKENLLQLPLWEGDSIFLPYVLKKIPFIGTFYYQNQKLTNHQIQSFLDQ